MNKIFLVTNKKLEIEIYAFNVVNCYNTEERGEQLKPGLNTVFRKLIFKHTKFYTGARKIWEITGYVGSWIK